ncbi:hypothetical protein TUM20985_24550 [Mycobacterium antarcticum]|nr:MULTISPECIES: hypothetical protein [unclassified Mycolicibacterium]BDX31908.1 hypothetical protein TUM20985_24550 [Mycolicibacterium sp. TUM20985]GLP75209.1 hypothetical protein TUM20983_23190 [Mycolicibacterium sp. TUM20983]GLP80982.1 hypothetical protein TUM20984_24020 [Mycolicibacterium sp. TUM20984]
MDEAAIAAAIVSGPGAVIAADRNALITFWNTGAERTFGLAIQTGRGGVA